MENHHIDLEKQQPSNQQASKQALIDPIFSNMIFKPFNFDNIRSIKISLQKRKNMSYW